MRRVNATGMDRMNRIKAESVSMKAETSENAGVHRGLSCLSQLRQVNFAGITIPSDKPEKEAFRVSAGLNASRIQVKTLTYS